MPRVSYRSAITGRFVSQAYAEAHPDSTVKEVSEDAVQERRTAQADAREAS